MKCDICGEEVDLLSLASVLIHNHTGMEALAASVLGVKGKRVMKEWEIWMEGYMATGEHGTAQLLGKYSGETFDDAVRAYAEEEARDTGKTNVDFDRFGQGRHAIWACELFDNEADARKSFG